MKLVYSSQVENVLRRYLRAKGYKLSRRKTSGETGCDIIAKNKHRRIFLEVIGFQSAPPTRSREFYECFFRAISRYDDLKAGDRLVMALPQRFARGMPLRRGHYGGAWERLGNAFPALEIWYVDVDSSTVQEGKWLAKDDESSYPQVKASRKWEPGRGTIGHLVRQMIVAHHSYADIHEAVRAKFPRSRFNKKHYGWYKSQLRRTAG